MSGHIVQALGGHLCPTLLPPMKPTKTKPHFADVARHLTERITSGRFTVGSLLPTEMELCVQYQTSRHTVRAALHELQQLGVVSRRKNVCSQAKTSQPTTDFG